MQSRKARSHESRCSPNLFIVLEGVDGVGKTAVAKRLAETIEGIYYRTPPEIFDSFHLAGRGSARISIRHFIDQLGDVHVRFTFYLMGVVYASHQIRQVLRTRHVVCDRYLASTLAYHYALDSRLKDVSLGGLDIVSPDYQFLLDVRDEGVRMSRVRGRQQHSISDVVLETNEELLKRVRDEFGSLGMIVVDTTTRDVDSVVEHIVRRIAAPDGDKPSPSRSVHGRSRRIWAQKHPGYGSGRRYE